MNKKILLNSNILVYALEETNPYHQKAETLILNPNLDFFVTTKNISEYFAVCTKLNIPFDKTWAFYGSLCQNAGILFPNQTSLGKRHSRNPHSEREGFFRCERGFGCFALELEEGESGGCG
ncbi:MAG: hypothetical protein ABMA02_16160 [Saprospiraceae bacterium]